MEKLEKDVFEVVAYSGRAIFKRNGDAKLTGVRIEIEDLILEGTKDEKAAKVTEASKESNISLAGKASNPR
ncbi:MAG: hypothetical protein EOO01_35330 [Chitinophagaceae bacterium]|nr:MAG: hypothetical protein EOO01_35330 [Chitinophagaceae bacterium]